MPKETHPDNTPGKPTERAAKRDQAPHQLPQAVPTLIVRPSPVAGVLDQEAVKEQAEAEANPAREGLEEAVIAEEEAVMGEEETVMVQGEAAMGDEETIIVGEEAAMAEEETVMVEEEAVMVEEIEGGAGEGAMWVEDAEGTPRGSRSGR